MTTNPTNESTSGAVDWAAIDPALADDRAVFPAARVRELIAGTPLQDAAQRDADAVKRLRRVLAMLGLGKAVPEDDEGLAGCLFSVFGMIAGALERRDAFALPAHEEAMASFRKFAKQQGYPVITCAEMDTIVTADGLGPATFYRDRTEHAWRGWANRPGVEDYRERAHSAERGCFRAGLLFDPATLEWQTPAPEAMEQYRPLYQVATPVSNGILWVDVDHETFGSKKNTRTRIVYERVDAQTAPAAPVTASDVRRLGPQHFRALRFAQIAGCTCLTKTPEIEYHKPDCRYRVFAEVERYLESQTRSTAQDILSWARENEGLLNSREFEAIDVAVHRFLASHAVGPADSRYECTPKNGGASFIIDRAPDTWELRECDIRAVVGSSKSPLAAWEPSAGEDVSVCVDNALARAIAMLLSTRNGGDFLYASRLEFLREKVLKLLALQSGEPDVALLSSMAACLNHGFGLLSARPQQSMLDDMRKLYHEVVGRGYYKLENRSRYTEWLSSDIEGGTRATPGLNAPLSGSAPAAKSEGSTQ
ncbi:hypothetical protein G3A43_08560 [Paraburkholderia aspalathi]|nr:hypothetical protein [Paraburkholderia aspalathi]MBK3780308.1 hypothetical protein [Paraburkholderia aspalathi]